MPKDDIIIIFYTIINNIIISSYYPHSAHSEQMYNNDVKYYTVSFIIWIVTRYEKSGEAGSQQKQAHLDIILHYSQA